MIDRQPCGCEHDGSKWLELCEAHRTEFGERHAQAQKDYRAAEGTKRFKELL